MASAIYNNWIKKALDAYLSGGTFKAMLLNSSYTPDKDAHDFVNDVSANEVSGAGYTAGGPTVTLGTTLDNANDRVDLSLGGFTLTAATLTGANAPRYCVYYKDTAGAASTDDIIAVIDYGSDKPCSGGDFVQQASTIRVTNS